LDSGSILGHDHKKISGYSEVVGGMSVQRHASAFNTSFAPVHNNNLSVKNCDKMKDTHNQAQINATPAYDT